ncbi:MAG: hypothetical protein AB7D57_07685 [Desulfovibrionaceae bacterium]
MTRRAPALLAALALTLLLAPALAACAGRVGGPCSYETFPARGEIVSVAPDPDGADLILTAGYAGQRVTYKLMGDPNILGMRNLFTIQIRSDALGAIDPGPQWIEKYHVWPGKQFNVTVARITSGTCTPVIATPTGLDVTDDFEVSIPDNR